MPRPRGGWAGKAPEVLRPGATPATTSPGVRERKLFRAARPCRRWCRWRCRCQPRCPPRNSQYHRVPGVPQHERRHHGGVRNPRVQHRSDESPPVLVASSNLRQASVDRLGLSSGASWNTQRLRLPEPPPPSSPPPNTKTKTKTKLRPYRSWAAALLQEPSLLRRTKTPRPRPSRPPLAARNLRSPPSPLVHLAHQATPTPTMLPRLPQQTLPAHPQAPTAAAAAVTTTPATRDESRRHRHRLQQRQAVRARV